ncbi:MAG: hypothetical protein U0165_05065 [Polyangiaceae bacterium]
MSSSRAQRLLISSFFAASTVFLAYGCNQSEAAQSRDKSASKSTPAETGGAVKAGAKVDDSRYLVELRPVGEYTNGKEGVFEVYLETKGDYHVNAEYPHKFSPNGGDGATYKGPVGKDSGSLEHTKLSLKVPFTPNRTGNVTVAGKFSFGFCTDAQCEMGKLDLELSVPVK